MRSEGGGQKKKKKKRRKIIVGVVSLRFDYTGSHNHGIFPGSLGTRDRLTFQFSAFGRERRGGGGLVVFTSCTRCPMGAGVKQSRLLSRFKPRAEIRAS